MTALTLRRTAVIAMGVLALASCSESGDAGIAHLGGDSNPTASASPSAGTSEEQALAFAQCMRDNGVDFADPTVDSEGNLTFAGAFDQSQGGGFNPGDSSFQDAMTACQDLMQGLVLGGGQAGGGFDSTAMQDAMLTYTQCLRDEGLDVGDITFDGPGLRGDGADGPGSGVQPTAIPSGGPAAGVRQDGGDRTDMFAEILGQDPTDPAWIAANTACASTLEAVTSSFGPGGASANGQG